MIKCETAKKYCYRMNRNMLNFNPQVMNRPGDNSTPTVKVHVSRSDTKQIILIEWDEFLKVTSTLQQEYNNMKFALNNDLQYSVPEAHDPIHLFMDHPTPYGFATIHPCFMKNRFIQNLRIIQKTNMVRRNVGKLEVIWTPLAGPGAQEQGVESFYGFRQKVSGTEKPRDIDDSANCRRSNYSKISSAIRNYGHYVTTMSYMWLCAHVQGVQRLLRSRLSKHKGRH